MKRLSGLLAIAWIVVIGSEPAAAQIAGAARRSVPAPAVTQRRAILDALRPAIERRLGPNVEFVVRDLRTADGWALVVAEPQRRGGGRIDGHRYFANFDDMDGLTVTAVLRVRGGRWTLVDHAIGATDVWYCGVAPRSLAGC